MVVGEDERVDGAVSGVNDVAGRETMGVESRNIPRTREMSVENNETVTMGPSLC